MVNLRVIPDKTPFLISGDQVYYIGFIDLIPRPIGYHIKGEMNGMWIPPLRLVKWITVISDGQKIVPSAFEIHGTFRRFEFTTFSVELHIGSRKEMEILFLPNKGFTGEVAIEGVIGVIPVWNSDIEPNTLINKNMDEIRVSVDNYSSSFRISTFPPSDIELDGELFKATFKSKGSLVITGETEGILSNEKLSKLRNERIAYMNNRMTSNLVLTGVGLYRDALVWAKQNLLWLSLNVPGVGRGIVAGYPEFPWFFSIDAFYSGRGLLLAGLINEYKNTLDLLALYARQQNGRIPHEILSNGKIYSPGNVQESALFPAQALELYKWTGDISFIHRNRDIIYGSIGGLLKSGLEGRGIMEDSHSGSGIDIDSVCNYVEGLHAIKEICEITDDPFTEPHEIDTEINEKLKFLEKQMWMPELKAYSNRFIDGVPQFDGFWTTIVPFSSRLGSKVHYNQFASEDNPTYKRMIKKGGILVDSGGNIMPIGNSLMARSCFNYSDPERGMSFIDMNIDTLGKFSPGCYPEISNNNKGCFIQAWSAALLIESIISDLLGIKAENTGVESHINYRIPEKLLNMQILGIAFRGSVYNAKMGPKGVELKKVRPSHFHES